MLKKIADFFKSLYHTVTKTVPKEIRGYSDYSLQITYGLKKALSGPVGEVITAIIPGNWDDKLRNNMIQYINEVLPYLVIVNECKDKGDVEAMLKCWVDKLRGMPEHTRNALLIKFAALLTSKQDGAKLKQSLYDYAVQAEYTAVIKKGNFETKYKDKLEKEK